MVAPQYVKYGEVVNEAVAYQVKTGYSIYIKGKYLL